MAEGINQTTRVQRAQCSTCQHWLGDEVNGTRLCHWPQPALPFWANISNVDHEDWTRPGDGRDCAVWETNGE